MGSGIVVFKGHWLGWLVLVVLFCLCLTIRRISLADGF